MVRNFVPEKSIIIRLSALFPVPLLVASLSGKPLVSKESQRETDQNDETIRRNSLPGKLSDRSNGKVAVARAGLCNLGFDGTAVSGTAAGKLIAVDTAHHQH